MGAFFLATLYTNINQLILNSNIINDQSWNRPTKLKLSSPSPSPNPLSQQVPSPGPKSRQSLKKPKIQFFGLGLTQ